MDDAHLLPPHRFRPVARRPSLVLATQEDLTHRLEMKGFEVSTLSVTMLAGPGFLRRLVDRRMEWARRRPGPLPRIDEAELAALSARHGSDIRAIAQ